MNLKNLTKKYLSGQKLLKKEEMYFWKKLRDKADQIFSKYIRKKYKKCITCWWPVQHNAHRIDRAWYSHRWNEDNCAGACANCNTYHSEEHKIQFTIIQIKKFWQERVDHQMAIRNKIKPTIDELLDIITKYTNLLLSIQNDK